MNETVDQNERAILLRFHEVALKGMNRGWFEERLAINARRLVTRALNAADTSAEGNPQVHVSHAHGRLILHAPWNPQVRQGLERVFGLTGISPIRLVETSIPKIQEAAIEEFRTYVAKHGVPRTFRVQTRRSDKALPQTSMEIDRQIGGEIQDLFPSMMTDLKNPEFTLGIEIRFERSYIWLEKYKTHGGLPVGTNGRTLALMSGGLDSPVAAIQILRRGSPVSFIHFYGAPFVPEESLEKVEDLVRIVNRYQPDPQPLHVVPFGKLQERIASVTNPKLRTVLYRRMMIRIAAEVAKRIEAQALVTGEALGQVASQTLENMSTIDEVATLPILRPLVGYDKDEIIEAAKKWGTYETSIRPGIDCCTLFADRHPTLRSSPALVAEQEEKFSVQELVNEALSGLELRGESRRGRSAL